MNILSEKSAVSVFKIAVSILFFCGSLFAHESRNALLIANGEYTHFSGLSEPVKEAENLRAALEQIGFSVKVVKNASLEAMNDALSDFEATLKKSGGTGFFHYGGHAVQVAGKNYLIPSTADIPDERRVSTRALNVDEVMNSMVADTNIVVLDSCRNNPLPAGSGRSASRGLVISSVRPKNSIIVYSAEAGCTARDGVFTPALTKEITRKGVSLQAVLINVRKEVQRLTDGAQTPGEYSQMTDIVYLAGKNAMVVPATSYDGSAAGNKETLSERLTVDGYVGRNRLYYVVGNFSDDEDAQWKAQYGFNNMKEIAPNIFVATLQLKNELYGFKIATADFSHDYCAPLDYKGVIPKNEWTQTVKSFYSTWNGKNMALSAAGGAYTFVLDLRTDASPRLFVETTDTSAPRQEDTSLYVVGDFTKWQFEKSNGMMDEVSSGIWKTIVYFRTPGTYGFKISDRAWGSIINDYGTKRNMSILNGSWVTVDAAYPSGGSTGNMTFAFAKGAYEFTLDINSCRMKIERLE